MVRQSGVLQTHTKRMVHLVITRMRHFVTKGNVTVMTHSVCSYGNQRLSEILKIYATTTLKIIVSTGNCRGNGIVVIICPLSLAQTILMFFQVNVLLFVS